MLCEAAKRKMGDRLPGRWNQLAAAVALVCTVAGCSVWLYITVLHWRNSIKHPIQSVSYEPLQQLPMFFGSLVGVYVDGVTFDDISAAFRVLPFWWTADGNPRYANVECTTRPDWSWNAVCFPTADDGSLLLKPVAGELDGASALGMRPEDFYTWPMQYTSAAEGVELAVIMLLDTNAVQKQSWAPYVDFELMNAQQALSAEELQERGTLAELVQLQSQVISIIASVNTWTTYKLDATRTERLNGTEALSYQYTSVGQLPLIPEDIDVAFLNVLEHTPDFNARQRLLEMRQNPNYTLYCVSLSLQYDPALSVRVITEVQEYTARTFLSDLGGFGSLLLTALFFLFPAVKPTHPRVFIPMWIARKFNKIQQRQQQQQHTAHSTCEHCTHCKALADSAYEPRTSSASADRQLMLMNTAMSNHAAPRKNSSGDQSLLQNQHG